MAARGRWYARLGTVFVVAENAAVESKKAGVLGRIDDAAAAERDDQFDVLGGTECVCRLLDRAHRGLGFDAVVHGGAYMRGQDGPQSLEVARRHDRRVAHHEDPGRAQSTHGIGDARHGAGPPLHQLRQGQGDDRFAHRITMLPTLMSTGGRCHVPDDSRGMLVRRLVQAHGRAAAQRTDGEVTTSLSRRARTASRQTHGKRHRVD